MAKLNEYFKKMLEAKKKNKSSFKYKGTTYKRSKSKKTGMIVYKKQKGGGKCPGGCGKSTKCARVIKCGQSMYACEAKNYNC